MQEQRRKILIGSAGLLSVAALRPVLAQPRKLRFGVGPLLPNPEDTKQAYTPIFAHLASQLGADFELFATTDWAGMAVAMASGNLDLAWMGPGDRLRPQPQRDDRQRPRQGRQQPGGVAEQPAAQRRHRVAGQRAA